LRDDPPPGVLGALLFYDAEAAVARVEPERVLEAQWLQDVRVWRQEEAVRAADPVRAAAQEAEAEAREEAMEEMIEAAEERRREQFARQAELDSRDAHTGLRSVAVAEVEEEWAVGEGVLGW
jgi:hypothetical protein